MSKRFIITLVSLIVIGLGAALAVFFAKGYTFSPQKGGIVGTGIITVSSVPEGALVYIDEHLTTATDTTLSQLTPGSYKIKLVKEGFIPWEKQVEVKMGLVSEIKATLFPALPTIYPLTYNGVVNPVLSPDGQKLAFAVPMTPDPQARQKGGVWVWTMTSAPISFSRSAEPHQIVVSSTGLDFTNADFRWSPDSKSLLVSIEEGKKEGAAFERNYLLSSDRLTDAGDLRDITPLLDQTTRGWEEDQKIKEEARILAIEDLKVRQIASTSAFTGKLSSTKEGKNGGFLRWSPDETKLLIKDGQDYKVYDLAEKKEYLLPKALSYSWLPESRHLVMVEEGKVSVAEFDGSNVAVIYAGRFEQGAVFSWPDSSRLVLLTSFNTPTASVPNLFGINLK
ncbi:MAG: PEGA domain-containing protein [Armatimonadetes bacterium]|nr:MAG: PEGA domain-containing protein [Armatimonadota bacterium]